MAFRCPGHPEPDSCRSGGITRLLIGGWEDGTTGPLTILIRELDGSERVVALVDGGRVEADDVPPYQPNERTVLADADGDVLELRVAQHAEDERWPYPIPPAVQVTIHAGAREPDVRRLLAKIERHLGEALELAELEWQRYVSRFP